MKYGGFSKVVAEKIISKEGSLEKKTIHFSKVLKQIKEGLIDVKELEEQAQAELNNKALDQKKHKKSNKKKAVIEQRKSKEGTD